MRTSEIHVDRILTRSSGFLTTVTSHSLQPYRGCSFGRSLCGVGCYVRQNGWLTRGREWGTFLEVRVDADASYREGAAREREWARANRGSFGVFLSSSTDPFVPQEARYGVTRRVLEAMLEDPPDELVLQTHTHRVTAYVPLYVELGRRCRLRVHLSIETDRERLDGLPPHASPVADRFAAARTLREAGVRTVITVSPLLPIADPDAFFARVSRCADAVVLDHWIGGDGTPGGTRTRRTPLPDAIARIDPSALELSYRDRMEEVARRHLGFGRVGVHIDGFAGRFR